ncbi:hypothetical protein CR513_48122, partial [Mucuna pruriens]
MHLGIAFINPKEEEENDVMDEEDNVTLDDKLVTKEKLAPSKKLVQEADIQSSYYKRFLYYHYCVVVFVSKTIITHEDKTVNKPEKDYTQDDYNTLQLNDTWDAIQITYEGIKDVQLEKAIALVRHYKMFTMKDDETIDKMFEIFQTILNGLNSLDKSITIQDSKNIKTLIIDELLGALRVHEVHLQKREKLALKDPLALKTRETSSKKEEKHLKALKVEMFSVLDDSSSERKDDEISLILMLKKKDKYKYFLENKDKYKKQLKEEKEVICFGCKKLGHFKVDFPKLRNRWYPKQQKSLIAT